MSATPHTRPQELARLPPEIIHRISALLDATHAPSLVALAQTNKHFYAIACSFLHRTIKLTTLDADRLSNDIQYYERILRRDDSLQHVQRLILQWVEPGYEEPPEHNTPYLALEAYKHAGDDDIHLQSCFDLYFEWWGFDDDNQAVISNRGWQPLVNFISQLPALTDVIYACPGPFPSSVLKVMETLKCRLHHYTFRLSAADDACLDADERALVTSPCLHSIGSVNYSRSNAIASRRIARQNAPHLRKVFAYWDENDPDNSMEIYKHSTCLGPNQHPIEYLQLYRDYIYTGAILSPLPLTIIDREIGLDFSGLQSLKINVLMADDILPPPESFPALRTFSTVCPQREFDEQDTWPNLFLDFIRHLPQLTTLRVFCWSRTLSIVPGLSPRLETLQLKTLFRAGQPPLRDDHILQMAELCPRLENLSLEVQRLRGNAAEVARYRALGRLPRLRRLELFLDSPPPGYIIDTEAVAAAAQVQHRYSIPPGHTVIEPWFDEGWDLKVLGEGLYPHRNGHLRDAMVNSAVDSTLAQSIVNVINDEKGNIEDTASVLPLERVELTPANGGEFPQVPIGKVIMPRKKANKFLRLLQRTWLVERDVRDDARHVWHARELRRAERLKHEWHQEITSKLPAGIYWEVWQRLWPTGDQGLDKWWEHWESWPLDLTSKE